MEISWSEFKQMVDERSLSIQYVSSGSNYHLKIIDGHFDVECLIPLDRGISSDTVDFEDNYKTNGNKSPTDQVVTQFEKRDKTLKLVSAQQDIDSNGEATILIKVPGTPGSADGRWLNSGMAWFDSPHRDDRILSVKFTDEDNLTGQGAGSVVGSYTDDEVDSSQQGWRIPIARGFAQVETIGGYGFSPAGFYIKIMAKKGGDLTTGTFYINIEWGKVE